jgi:hypothetical protein
MLPSFLSHLHAKFTTFFCDHQHTGYTFEEFAGNTTARTLSTAACPGPDVWIADTGATSHMTPNRHWFLEYKPCKIPVRLADNNVIYAAGVGSIVFTPMKNGQPLRQLVITSVLHVPLLANNLLSVLALTRKKDFEVHIKKSTMTFTLNSQLIFQALVGDDNCALLDGSTVIQASALKVSSSSLSPELWHRRFCHIGQDRWKQLVSGKLVRDLLVHNSPPSTPFPQLCEPCLAGKQHRSPFPHAASNRRTQPLELVHSDLHGPVSVQTPQGFRYWISFVDDYSRYRNVYLLHKKSDAFLAFKEFKAFAEKQTGFPLKALRDDKGGEYMSKEMDDFLKAHGIAREHTTTATPQQNGVAERSNRIFDEGITSLLNEAHLPGSFWGDALGAFIHVLNRSPSSAVKGVTPYEAWFKHKPSVSHLRVFGCQAYAHVQKNKRKSFESKTQRCIFIGYPPDFKGWKLYDPSTQKTLISRDVIFDEQTMPGTKSTLSDASYYPLSLNQVPESGGDRSTANHFTPFLDDISNTLTSATDSNPLPYHPPSPSPSPNPPSPSPPPSGAPSSSSGPTNLRRTTRSNAGKPPGEWWKVWEPREPTPDVESHSESEDLNEESEDELAMSAGLAKYQSKALSMEEMVEWAFRTSPAEPRSMKEAQKRDDWDLWYEAALKEYTQMLSHNTWELVPLPKGRKPVGSKWVFKIKENADGSIERYKARIVAQGFSQKPHLDYTETFAPVTKFASLRTILAIAAIEDLELHHMDVSSAFLNGDLQEDIYMVQPEGFVEPGKEHMVCHLKKSLYGLKQSPRQWYQKLHETFLDLGFKRCPSDNSIWVWAKDKVKVIIPVYVDDLTLACNNLDALTELKSKLQSKFEMRDLGELKYILGLEVHRNRPSCKIWLSQHKHTLDILHRFHHEHSRPVSTPLDPSISLSKVESMSQEEKEYMSGVPYLSAVGSLMYLAIGTRPDIAYAVGLLSRFNSCPAKVHWKAIQRVFQYLKGTSDFCLEFGPSTVGGVTLSVFSDSDYAGDTEKARSTSGYASFIGASCVNWSSRRQDVVAKSTTEAELIAANSGASDGTWLTHLLEELGFPQASPFPLQMDNQSSIKVAKNPEHHGKMKHLDTKYYWIRDQVDLGKLRVEWVPSRSNCADILTKALSKDLHQEQCQLLGLRRQELG